MGCLTLSGELLMSGPFSELVEISKLNGDFKRNYGKLIGAYLYLRSLSAARPRSYFWGSALFAVVATGVTWLERHGFSWLHTE
jgi:hypothetical protein